MSEDARARTSELVIEDGGRRATVRRGADHPEQYLYLEVEDRTYFLAVLEPGMTRGDVRRIAVEWLRSHTSGARITR